MSDTSQNVTETPDFVGTKGDVHPSGKSTGPVKIGDADHELVGQFYHDKSSDGYFVVKYIDRDIVLKQNVEDGKLFQYRMEKRAMFDKMVKTTDGSMGYNKSDEEEALADPYGKKAEARARQEELADQITEVSDLSQIKGMGQSKVDELVETYDTLEDVRNATDDELGDIKGVGRTLIKRVRDELGYPDNVEEESEDEEEEPEEPEETPEPEQESKELNEDDEDIVDEVEQTDDEADDNDDGWETLLEADDGDWSMDSL